MGAFKEPHGGELKDLYLSAEDAEKEKSKAKDYPSWDLTPRQHCDLELLLNGAFSPLEGFLNQDDYDSVVKKLRLTSGVLWPIPITLDVSDEFATELKSGQHIALRDFEGVLIATLQVGDIWAPDKKVEAKSVYGTADEAHPAVNYLNNIGNSTYIGGRLLGVEAPTHYDFKHLRDRPAEILSTVRFRRWKDF